MRPITAQVTQPPPYHPPVKRSVEIAGHKTSISLEPLFWEMLRAAAEAEIIGGLAFRPDQHSHQGKLRTRTGTSTVTLSRAGCRVTNP